MISRSLTTSGNKKDPTEKNLTPQTNNSTGFGKTILTHGTSGSWDPFLPEEMKEMSPGIKDISKETSPRLRWRTVATQCLREHCPSAEQLHTKHWTPRKLLFRASHMTQTSRTTSLLCVLLNQWRESTGGPSLHLPTYVGWTTTNLEVTPVCCMNYKT